MCGVLAYLSRVSAWLLLRVLCAPPWPVCDRTSWGCRRTSAQAGLQERVHLASESLGREMSVHNHRTITNTTPVPAPTHPPSSLPPARGHRPVTLTCAWCLSPSCLSCRHLPLSSLCQQLHGRAAPEAAPTAVPSTTANPTLQHRPPRPAIHQSPCLPTCACHHDAATAVSLVQRRLSRHPAHESQFHQHMCQHPAH